MRGVLYVAGALALGASLACGGCVGPAEEATGEAVTADSLPFGPDLDGRAARLVELAVSGRPGR